LKVRGLSLPTLQRLTAGFLSARELTSLHQHLGGWDDEWVESLNERSELDVDIDLESVREDAIEYLTT